MCRVAVTDLGELIRTGHHYQGPRSSDRTRSAVTHNYAERYVERFTGTPCKRNKSSSLYAQRIATHPRRPRPQSSFHASPAELLIAHNNRENGDNSCKNLEMRTVCIQFIMILVWTLPTLLWPLTHAWRRRGDPLAGWCDHHSSALARSAHSLASACSPCRHVRTDGRTDRQTPVWLLF